MHQGDTVVASLRARRDADERSLTAHLKVLERRTSSLLHQLRTALALCATLSAFEAHRTEVQGEGQVSRGIGNAMSYDKRLT